MTRLLIEVGADPNRRTPHGETALYLAASNGHTETVIELLRGNADALLTTGVFTPMEVAAGKGHSETVLELIQRLGMAGCGGASRGVDALNYAGQRQHVDTMAVLTNAGVVDTGAALSGTVGHGSERSVLFLLRQQTEETIGSYVNSANPPLLLTCMMSVAMENMPLAAPPMITRMLIDAGVTPTAPMRVTHPDEGREETFNTTPVHLVTDWILEKKVGESSLSEEQLHALQAIRRLLLQEDAVHAVSWLWPSEAPVQTAQGARKATTTSKPLASMMPIMRRRSGAPARGVLLRALLRWVWVGAACCVGSYEPLRLLGGGGVADLVVEAPMPCTRVSFHGLHLSALLDANPCISAAGVVGLVSCLLLCNVGPQRLFGHKYIVGWLRGCC